ncbi:MAG: cohesin domain-containing protein [Patescibacteria group bacterium]|nr:cohesin domain-containing protein [Patescibacteria group bacterium]
MSKRSIILILILAGVTFLLLYIALSQGGKSGKGQNANRILPKPSLSQAQTTLYLSPNPLTVANATASALVMINTNTNAISGAQIELSYNPAKLTDVAVYPGKFFSNAVILLNRIDRQNGRIFYALVLPHGAAPKKGTGVLAAVRFRPLLTNGDKTQIRFMPKTLIIAPNIGQSLLLSSMGATVIGGGQPSAATGATTSAY